MFSHLKDLQFEAKPDGPDAAFARRLQEILGGKWGELTVANQYLFQGWSCRLPGKYKDLLLDVAIVHRVVDPDEVERLGAHELLQLLDATSARR